MKISQGQGKACKKGFKQSESVDYFITFALTPASSCNCLLGSVSYECY